MRAREADPLDAVDRVARAQQLAELGVDVGREVAAPGVDVLAEQRDLADAVGGERVDLGDDLPRPPALLAAADGGDDAVRARRVAAHRDLHPGLEAPLAVHREVGGEVLVRAEATALDREAAGPIQSPRCGIEPGPNATSTNGYSSKIRSRCASA